MVRIFTALKITMKTPSNVYFLGFCVPSAYLGALQDFIKSLGVNKEHTKCRFFLQHKFHFLDPRPSHDALEWPTGKTKVSPGSKCIRKRRRGG